METDNSELDWRDVKCLVLPKGCLGRVPPIDLISPIYQFSWFGVSEYVMNWYWDDWKAQQDQ